MKLPPAPIYLLLLSRFPTALSHPLYDYLPPICECLVFQFFLAPDLPHMESDMIIVRHLHNYTISYLIVLCV